MAEQINQNQTKTEQIAAEIENLIKEEEKKTLKESLKNYFKNRTRRWKRYLILVWIFLFLIIFVFGIFAGYFYFKKTQEKSLASQNIEKNIYWEFLSEVYDKIKENYWDKISDEQLTNLFKLGAEKLTNSPQTLEPANKEGLKKMVEKIIKTMEKDKKKEFTTNLANIVLANLNPFGRSGIYTQKDEEKLKNLVQNINPEKNLYQSLGLDKNASKTEIKEAFEKKSGQLELKKEKEPEAKKELEELQYAYEVLSKPESKERYDHLGIEPTVFSRIIKPDIFYLRISKFSPTTFDEFQKAANDVENEKELNSLLLDLRGNIGGSIDILPYFLGPFIGQNQYAYEFFHQGEYTPFKTKTGWLAGLVKYKKVVILIDRNTQSSAEVMAAVLKRYNVGVLLGLPTKGWGTVEKVFNLESQLEPTEKYSMFLVHSLTLREDNQPIEGKGVEPAINIQDKDWQKQLFSYFNYQPLIEAVKQVLEL